MERNPSYYRLYIFFGNWKILRFFGYVIHTLCINLWITQYIGVIKYSFIFN